MTAGRTLALAIAAALALAIVPELASSAFAAPFGTAAPQAPAGIFGLILAKQAEFYRLLTSAVRAAKTDGSAFGMLGAISFAYGVFHAAGPGHGKAVISSYLLANEATLKRGAALAFASALLQALTAIAVAGVFSALLGATAATMQRAVSIIEIAAYALIMLIGLRLFWSKAGAFMAAWRGAPSRGHVHGPECGCGEGHAHIPDAAAVPTGGWREMAVAVASIGLRPCSGAVLVLVFALAQGVFWIGAGATLLMGLGTALTVTSIAALAVFGKRLAVRLATTGTARRAELALRGLECLAALLLVGFGAALLTGYMASERLFFS